MRYNPNRSYFHPVLRPHSDDYGDVDATSGVRVTWKRIANDYHISVEFTIAVAGIREAVDRGSASCLAVLYCPSTLYRQAISKCPVNSLVLEGRVPRNSITGHIEIYPIVVANYSMELDTRDAHSDYGNRQVRVRKGAPLATYYPWICDAPEELRPVESIVVLDSDGSLDDGEFEVETDTAENYIIVKTNQKTRGDWDAVGSETRMATVYMAAITQALGEMGATSEDSDSDVLWVACLRRQLRIQNIGLPARDEDEESSGDRRKFVSPARAAQLLLRNPMASLLACNQDDEDEE